MVSGYYRIGVLKSIGFTPGQIMAIYLGQAIVPAVAGCLAGLALGNLMAGALLNRAASAFQVNVVFAGLIMTGQPVAIAGAT